MGRGLVLGLVAMAFVAACHSSPENNDGGAGGNAGSGSGGAGFGGTSAAGANGDASPPSDAPADHEMGTGGANGGAGGAIGTTPTEVCRAAVTALCERVATCLNFDLRECLRYLNACPDYYFNADSRRTVAGIAACVEQLRARTCTDVKLGIYPPCLVAGTRAEGAACAYSSQCTSGTCNGQPGTCGTCTADDTPLGGSCFAFGCANGGFCTKDTQICIDVALIKHAVDGQPCDPGASPPVGCAGDLVCAPTDAGSAGVCRSAIGAGATCAGGPQCMPETSCQSSTAGGFTCVPRAALGAPCSQTFVGERPPCLSPGLCNANPENCVVRAELGDACVGGCDTWLSCVGGKCVPFKDATCSP